MRLMNNDLNDILRGCLEIIIGSWICIGAGTRVHDTHSNAHLLCTLGIYMIGERTVKRGDETLSAAGVDTGLQPRIFFTLSAFLVGALFLKDAKDICQSFTA